MRFRHIVGAALIVAAVATVTTAVRAGNGDKVEMDLIISAANVELCDHDYSDASATIRIRERNDGTTDLTLKVKNAKPSHIHTMWLKLASGSPLTGAGATPTAGTGDIDGISAAADSGSDAGANAFYTNAAGNGTLHVTLDFHLSDGVYPFSAYDSELSDVGIGNSPFLFRVISHCTDDEQHGLVPGVHEPTFQMSQ